MTHEIAMTPWHPKNKTPFQPPENADGSRGISEGNGERKYAHELSLRGLDASHNTPGQNPDILIVDGPGREVKELKERRIRLSASQPVMLALAKTIIRPLFPLAQEILDENDFDLMTIGNVKALGLRKLLSSSVSSHPYSMSTRPFFRMVFEHSKIDHIVLVYRQGYVELDFDRFCKIFELYKIDKFVATVWLRNGMKIVEPKVV